MTRDGTRRAGPMSPAQAMERMIAASNGNQRDIAHFMAVWSFARTIGRQEGLDEHTLYILEVAAIVHDIACPLCREKYGSAEGRLQERESDPLVRAFLADAGMAAADVDRVAFLVCHHHTVEGIDGPDYQVLIEADFIVNAMEKGWSRENVARFRDQVMRTGAGRRIADAVFGL